MTFFWQNPEQTRPRTHEQLEFSVEDAGGHERIFKTWDEACGFAVSLAASDGRKHDVDVLAWTREAAVFWMGEYGGEQYDEDPEASVFDRIEVSADHVGRVA